MSAEPVTATTAGLADWVRDNPHHALIDVSENGEFIKRHVPGFINIPRGDLHRRIAPMVPDPAVSILLCCRDGRRSARAADLARAAGFDTVNILAGGTDAWDASGAAIEAGSNVLGKRYGEHVAIDREVHQITPAELDALNDRGDVAMLDVRTAREYRTEGHLPGAASVPSTSVAAVAELLRNEHPARPIVVNCAGRTRSIVAADKLRALGHENVFALENGTMAWLLADRELDTDEVPAPAVGDDDVDAILHVKAHEIARASSIPSITAEQLAAVGRDGIPHYLLDVRSGDAHVRGTLRGAVSCPEGQLTNHADDVMAVRTIPVICFSTREAQAILAARTLRGMGFADVRWLKGGVSAWPDPGAIAPPAAHEDRAPVPGGSAELLDVAGVRLGSDTVVVDARSMSDYVTAHIPGSIWIPVGLLDLDAPAAVGVDSRILLVGRDDASAAFGVALLRDAGIEAQGLRGGLDAWTAAGNLTASGPEGNDIDMTAAREEADLVGYGPAELRRTPEDMMRYIAWEIALAEE